MKNLIMAMLAVFLSTGHAWAEKSQAEVKALVEKQTGYHVSTSDHKSEIERLLNEPLSEDAAVKIAILNSPLVKAQLSSLGISEADMREAGILRNPTVTFSSRTSKEEGAKRNNEIEVKQDVLDVLFWPLRKNQAGTRFKAAQYDAAQNVVNLVKAVRLDYFEWLAAVHKRQIAQDYFKAQEAALEISRREKEAGNINTLQFAGTQAVFQKSKIEWLKTQQEVETSKQHLRVDLGLKTDQSFMEEAVEMPDLPKENLVLVDLEKQMLDHRLNLAMKRQEIKALEQSLTLASLGFLPETQVGYDQETETDGNKLKGIVVEGQVPIFNRKQAQRQNSKASIETAKHQLDAMEQQALSDVRMDYQNIMTSRQLVGVYKESVTVYQQMIKETLYHYNYMLTDVFHLLQAKQAALEAQEGYVDALKGYWVSRAELEYAVGIKLPYDLIVPTNNQQEKLKEHDHNHGG